MTYSALSCLLLSACSSGGPTDGTAGSENGAGQGALTEIMLREQTGVYSHSDAGLSYAVDDVQMTFASTDSSKTFQVDGKKLVVGSDICISVTSIDFTNAKFFKFTDDGGRDYLASPLPVEVNRIINIYATSETPYQYYSYDKNTIISAEQSGLNPALLYGDYVASSNFDKASDEPNLPSGMCFLVAGNEVVIELSLTATSTDGATLLLFYED